MYRHDISVRYICQGEVTRVIGFHGAGQVDNYVNPWEVPGEPQYGCSNVLETGDPLVGVDFAAGDTNPDPVTGPAWHLQDEAFLWWFERQPTHKR